MKLWLAMCRGALIPTDDESRALLDRMGEGECCQVTIVRPRSVQMHRLYFGICRAIGQNQEPQRDESSIDYELRIRAGHYDVMFVGGEKVLVAKRIAFDKLTHDEWMQLWPSLELAIRETFGEEYLREAA